MLFQRSLLKPLPLKGLSEAPRLYGFEEYDFAVSEVGRIVAEGDLNGDSLPDAVFWSKSAGRNAQVACSGCYQAPDGNSIRGESSGNFGPEPLTYLDLIF